MNVQRQMNYTRPYKKLYRMQFPASSKANALGLSTYAIKSRSPSKLTNSLHVVRLSQQLPGKRKRLLQRGIKGTSAFLTCTPFVNNTHWRVQQAVLLHKLYSFVYFRFWKWNVMGSPTAYCCAHFPFKFTLCVIAARVARLSSSCHSYTLCWRQGVHTTGW